MAQIFAVPTICGFYAVSAAFGLSVMAFRLLMLARPANRLKRQFCAAATGNRLQHIV